MLGETFRFHFDIFPPFRLNPSLDTLYPNIHTRESSSCIMTLQPGPHSYSQNFTSDHQSKILELIQQR